MGTHKKRPSEVALMTTHHMFFFFLFSGVFGGRAWRWGGGKREGTHKNKYILIFLWSRATCKATSFSAHNCENEEDFDYKVKLDNSVTVTVAARNDSYIKFKAVFKPAIFWTSYLIQSNLNSSNTDDSCYMANSNSFFESLRHTPDNSRKHILKGIFLLYYEIVRCVYSLESPHRGDSILLSTHNTQVLFQWPKNRFLTWRHD